MAIELTGAEVPQHVRRDPVRPVGQMPGGGVDQRGPQRLVADPGRSAVGVAALRGEQGNAGASVVVVEVAPHVFDEPAQRLAGVVDDQRSTDTAT